MTDTIETLVYYVEAGDLFVKIKWGAAARHGDWVVVEREEDGETCILAEFDGRERHLGLVVILDYYPLTQSEQWTETPEQREGRSFQ